MRTSELPVPKLSVDEAIARRGELHGHTVLIYGVLSVEFEDTTLRPPDLRKRSRETARKLWLDLRPQTKDQKQSPHADLGGSLVEVSGTLDANDHGHMNVFPATLKDIKAIKKSSGN